MRNFTLESATDAYRETREKLRQAEIALKDQRETVAALRRALPAETTIPEAYVFTEAAANGPRPVALADLFADDRRALIVIHFMWAPQDARPCPMCAMWADGFNAVAPHVAQKAPMVVIAKQDAAQIQDYADGRGWANLRFLSSGGTRFNRDFAMEDENESQWPGVSIFLRGDDGSVRHFYTAGAIMGDDNYRGMDLYSPVWNLFDLLPNGRGDWMPGLSYET